MLDGLNDINWNDLTHAYGSAHDVPGLIRALADPDSGSRDNAIYALQGNIWHQGTVYEATAYTVPFFIELLKDPDVEDKAEIVLLLAHIANGRSYIDVHQHLEFVFSLEERNTPEFKARLKRELEWVRLAHTAVADHLEFFFDLMELHHPTELRATAPYILTMFPERYSTLAPRLKAQLHHESSALVKASLLLALRSVLKPDPFVVHLFTPFLDQGEPPIVRFASALALTWLAPDVIPEQAVDCLSEMLECPERIGAVYQCLPWADGDPRSMICHALTTLKPERAQTVLPLLLETLICLDGTSVISYVSALLRIAFNGSPLPQSMPFHALSSSQQKVLTALLTSDNVWQFNGNMFSVLRGFGLPSQRSELKRFVAR